MFPTFIESIEGAFFWKTAISFYVWMALTYTKGIFMINFSLVVCDLPYGLAVRIPGFHPGGPGSTPGMGTRYLFHFAWLFLNMYFFYFTNSFKFFFQKFYYENYVFLSTFFQISESLLQIILCVRNEVAADNSFTQLIQQNKTAANFLGEPFVANVAKHPPLTREQFNQASLLWPVNFHEDK